MNLRLTGALPRPVFVLLILAVVAAMAPALGSAAEITIQVIVTPTTLNLASGGSVVTAQTDIPYREVEASSIYLNGVALDWWVASPKTTPASRTASSTGTWEDLAWLRKSFAPLKSRATCS